MKTKKFLLLTLSILSLGSLLGFVNQEDPLTKLLKDFQNYFSENVQEKVYLHTDKPYYAVGDQIWFKAYVVNAKSLQPSPKSNIVYIDLIDSKDVIKKTLRLPLTAGFGSGNFELKDSLNEGNYRLRAYTSWMRNFDQALFFDRTIKIGNAWTSQLLTTANYSFSQDGKNENIKSNINFKNLEGFAYADKDVTYEVEIGGRQVSKGKTKTDSQGNIVLDFTNSKAGEDRGGRILANIEVAKGTVVHKLIPIKSTSSDIDVRFFPESGDLIQQVRSKVAFKAVGTDGLGKEISGFIQDNGGKKVAIITTKHLGMGAFTMVPEPGKIYEAVIALGNGSEKRVKLPEARPIGSTLSVNILEDDSILVKVSVNPSTLTVEADKEYTVIVQNSGNVLYTAKSKIQSLAFAAKLPKTRFVDGISQFTLFNEKMQPIAERLIFIAPRDTLAITIEGDKNSYAPRGKTKLKIKAVNPAGKSVIGSFSMSIVDAGKVTENPDEEESIYTNLLLTSDIKGYVEKPNYYLSNINNEKIAAVDLLMLTQAWRRFTWQSLDAPKPVFAFKPEKTLSISGRVTQGRDKPVNNGTVTVFSSSGKSFLIQTKTNELGEFMVDSLYFPDSTKFVVQARNEKGRKGMEIEVFNSTLPAVTKNMNQGDLTVNINESMVAYLKNSKSQYEEWLRNGIVNRSILLGEVVVTEKRAEVENSSNLNGAGNADKVLTEKDLENANTLEQALQGRVAGLTVVNGVIYIRNQAAQIVMDGIFLDSGFVTDVNMPDVESIEILKSAAYTAIYGGRGGGGVIVINTKSGKSGYVVNTYAPGIMTYQPIGLFRGKEFYMPNYADPKINKTIADLRTTIYWNPNVITDSSGNAEVEFYNADNTGNFKITLEGMDLNGHLARKVSSYKVVKSN